jgi:hypothetical protein
MIVRVRLLNFATWLSLLLSVAAATLWVRGRCGLTDTWVFRPRPSGISFNSTGWKAHREVGSEDGYAVLVQYERFDVDNPAFPPETGYHSVDDYWLATIRNRNHLLPSYGAVEGGIPGVATWCYVQGAYHPKRYVAVSWLAFAAVGAALPAARLVARWRRRRRPRGPAFPVLPARPS